MAPSVRGTGSIYLSFWGFSFSRRINAYEAESRSLFFDGEIAAQEAAAGIVDRFFHFSLEVFLFYFFNFFGKTSCQTKRNLSQQVRTRTFVCFFACAPPPVRSQVFLYAIQISCTCTKCIRNFTNLGCKTCHAKRGSKPSFVMQRQGQHLYVVYGKFPADILSAMTTTLWIFTSTGSMWIPGRDSWSTTRNRTTSSSSTVYLGWTRRKRKFSKRSPGQ